MMISCLLCTSIIAGCSKDTAATGGNSEQQAAATQGAFERPDLSGEITEVNGNEVTLKKLSSNHKGTTEMAATRKVTIKIIKTIKESKGIRITTKVTQAELAV
ncbi:hypothetical protein GCM10020331_028060 [Ectobacillus funiculus]